MRDSELNPLVWDSMQPHVDGLLDTSLSDENVGGWLQKWSDFTAVLHEADAQIYRDVTENTTDKDAEARFELFVDQILPQAKRAEQALKQKLLAFGETLPIDDTAQMMKRFQAEAAIFRDENVPLLSELIKLANEYDKMIGAMAIEWDGESITMPQANQKLQDPNRDTRERAWRLIMARYAQDREALDELYIKMLRLRRQVARNAGFDSFRAYQWQDLNRFDYTPEDCFTFHDAIEHEVVPVARKYYAELQKALNLDTLRPWDTKVDPSGQPLKPFSDAAELEEVSHHIFQQVDPVLAQHFAVMRESHLDLASRPNKAPGGYCNSFPASKKPYIFMNAVGTHNDVTTLLHEGGHAFHFMESSAQPLVWNHNGPMEFCEVASMAMELLSAPYLTKEQGGFYNESDMRRAYTQKLLDTPIFFLPYMAVVDAFQHWVYADAPEEVTAADLDAKWSELWDRFMVGIDYSGLQDEKESGWHRKLHIFTVPFYYIEYGLAQIGALQVWRNAMKDQAQAVADYRTALALGDTRPLPDLFRAAGATFAFDRQVVGELMGLVNQQLEQLAA